MGLQTIRCADAEQEYLTGQGSAGLLHISAKLIGNDAAGAIAEQHIGLSFAAGLPDLLSQRGQDSVQLRQGLLPDLSAPSRQIQYMKPDIRPESSAPGSKGIGSPGRDTKQDHTVSSFAVNAAVIRRDSASRV